MNGNADNFAPLLKKSHKIRKSQKNGKLAQGFIFSAPISSKNDNLQYHKILQKSSQMDYHVLRFIVFNPKLWPYPWLS